MATENQENENEYVSIKSTLNAILREQHANEVKEIIFDRCVVMTKISSLASLLLLHKVNSAVPTDRDFFLRNGKSMIYDCFDAVTAEHMAKMPPEFRNRMETIHEDNFQWPSKNCLNNSLQYFREQYVTNLKTNLNTHCVKRLEYFLRMRCYQINLEQGYEAFDGTDIRNILKDVIKDQDWTNGDHMREGKKIILWQQLTHIGFPANTNIKQYVKDDWFKSIWSWIRIQREIEEFLIHRAEEIEQWKLFSKDPKKNAKPTGM